MSASLAQLTAQIQIPLEKIPYYRARSRESDFAERLSADLASAVIPDQSERQQLLSKASIPLSVVRLDTTDNPPLLATPIKTPITKIDCHDGAVICKISQNSSQHDFHPYDSRLHKPQNIEPFMYSTLEDDVSEGSQSMDIDNESVSDWSAIQTPASERRDRLNNNILRELFPAGSVGLVAGTSNEMDTAVAEAVRQDASTENTAYGSRVSNTEVPDDIPFFDQSSNFLSSDSNLQEEQLPARESTKDSAQTPGESSRKTPLQNSGYSNDATDRATGHHESDQLTQESQLTVKPQFGRPENSFANGDSLEDTESQFIPTHAHQAGQNTLRPETNSENPATLTEALIKDTDVDLSEISSRGTFESSLGSVEYCSNVESDARKSRKRRRAVASQNEDDDTVRYTAILSPRAFSDDGQTGPVAYSPLTPTEESREDPDAWSLFSQSTSRLTSPYPEPSEEPGQSEESEQSEEAIEEGETNQPNILESVHARLTSQQLIEAQRTCERLHFIDLAAFLEKYSCTWKVSGFWSGPSWDCTGFSSPAQRPHTTNLMTYLMRLHNENDIHDVKLRVARCSLFLFFVREIECERQRGTAETALKRNAISTLCNSGNLTPVEKRKLHKSFHNEKKIGEYWWWCVCYFGPSFLIRCSKEAGKKINNSRFSLDAMIAYALQGNSPATKPYLALDEAMIHLLITGKFPEAFSRQDVNVWGKYPHTESATLEAWRPFSTDVVTEEALANLNEWQANPANHLLKF